MILIVIILLFLLLAIRYFLFMTHAKKKLTSFDPLVQTIQTSYGKVSYIDKGSGTPILICHGIFGGYDQGYSCFKHLTNQYRILVPSRFGYPGTTLPDASTVTDQAKQYLEFLDQLGLDKVYVLGTSAGGACAIRFAIEYPERVKGLILYCSGGLPKVKPSETKIPSYNAVPKPLCNNLPLWMIGPILKKVMNCSAEDWLGVFPTNQRKDGVVNDGYHANRDLLVHYDEYKLEQLTIPVIAFHAKDDKLSNYDDMVHTISRLPNGTLISFETGGHMMTGNGPTVDKELESFIQFHRKVLL